MTTKHEDLSLQTTETAPKLNPLQLAGTVLAISRVNRQLEEGPNHISQNPNAISNFVEAQRDASEQAHGGAIEVTQIEEVAQQLQVRVVSPTDLR
ncbi:MAG: hypothetical protein JWM81_207 [Candidatus Saccharibacteria bacterium]|nr:hypothetical protein [Candidatus Saccharibacteria bacterium]